MSTHRRGRAGRAAGRRWARGPALETALAPLPQLATWNGMPRPAGAGEQDGRAPSRRALVLSFVAVAVAFVLSTAVAEYAEIEIRRDAAQITGVTAPRIERLAELRGQLRRFTLIADDEVDRGIDGWRPRAVTPEMRAARDGIDRAWASYRALSPVPGAGARLPAVDAAKRGMEAAVSSLVTAMERGDWPHARAALERGLKPSAE